MLIGAVWHVWAEAGCAAWPTAPCRGVNGKALGTGSTLLRLKQDPGRACT
jgi:hypothetical protein